MYQADRAYSYILYISMTLYLVSIVWGLFLTPEDFIQGNSYRIIYLHVPASFISQSLYIAMAIASAIFLIWKVKLSVYLVRSIAPIGAVTTFIALISGSIWGIPTWGTWWVWDARIVSTLILSVNIPIIKMSVEWWSTLHQPASITISNKPAIDLVMLYPLFGSIIGFTGIVVSLVILSSKLQILKRERNKLWIKDYV
jgi:heme exporter protein C